MSSAKAAPKYAYAPVEMSGPPPAVLFRDFMPQRIKKKLFTHDVFESTDVVLERAVQWMHERQAEDAPEGPIYGARLQSLWVPFDVTEELKFGAARSYECLYTQLQIVRVWFWEVKDAVPALWEPYAPSGKGAVPKFIDFGPKLLEKKTFKLDVYEEMEVTRARMQEWIANAVKGGSTSIVSIQSMWVPQHKCCKYDKDTEAEEPKTDVNVEGCQCGRVRVSVWSRVKYVNVLRVWYQPVGAENNPFALLAQHQDFVPGRLEKNTFKKDVYEPLVVKLGEAEGFLHDQKPGTIISFTSSFVPETHSWRDKKAPELDLSSSRIGVTRSVYISHGQSGHQQPIPVGFRQELRVWAWGDDEALAMFKSLSVEESKKQ